ASISQKAAATALNNDHGCVETMRKHYQRRHELVQKGLKELGGVRCLRSQGSFYCLPDFTHIIESMNDVRDDHQLANWLLDKAGVAMVPGSAFGAPGHLRLSFAASEADIKDALTRL